MIAHKNLVPNILRIQILSKTQFPQMNLHKSPLLIINLDQHKVAKLEIHTMHKRIKTLKGDNGVGKTHTPKIAQMIKMS